MSKEMSEFKIGDRVELVGEACNMNINDGDVGTVVANSGRFIGVDFDRDIGGHSCNGRGRLGHCWNIPCEDLEKLEEAEEEVEEETKEEIKTETMEQKILKALREEIGVEIGEEFDVYENGEKQWTCKFEENGFFDETNGKFRETGLWKNIISNFQCFKFKRKPFVPQNGEKYWHFGLRDSLKGNKSLDVLENVWDSLLFDYGMLALGNVFRNREEAIKGEDKLLERLNELLMIEKEEEENGRHID